MNPERLVADCLSCREARVQLDEEEIDMGKTDELRKDAEIEIIYCVE
jgi:hypothetical protein